MACRRLLLALLLTHAVPAQAGTLTSATWTTDLGLGPIVPVAPFSRAVSASGMSTATSIDLNLRVPQQTLQTFVTAGTPGRGFDYFFVSVTQGGTQSITATSQMANGDPGVPGSARIFGAWHASGSADASMFSIGPLLVGIPLYAGAAGRFHGTFTVVSNLHHITVDFYSWTAGTRVFTGLTSDSNPLPSAVARGAFLLTTRGGGTVTLVAPSKLSIDGVAQRRSVGFTTLTLHFVPEAGSVLLLGGAAFLLAFSQRGRES